MWEFFSKLFDTSDFPARWHCGNWEAGHGWLHILSDVGVWSAYVAIPCVLAYFVLKRKDIPFPAIFWLFFAFILACGTTHLMEAVIFWWPAYRLAGVIKFLTAVVSWSTIFALVSIVPKALSLSSPVELEKRVQDRTAELAETNNALQRAMQERIRIEASLREQHEWFAVTLASLGEGVIATDPDGNVTFVNEFATRLTGWPEHQAVGRSLNEILTLVHAQTGDLLDLPLAQLLGTNSALPSPLRMDAELRSEDGRATPVELAATPIRAGNVTLGLVFVLQNNTERNRRAAEQLEANDRIRSVVDHVVDGIITIDERGIITSFNPAAERIFGLEGEEMINQNVRVLMPEPFFSQHDEYIRNYLTTGDAKIIGIGREVIGRRKDGTTFPLDLAVSEFRWDKKRYFTGIVRDITERKESEKLTHFLADASDVLATLVDFNSAVEKVARLSVPFLADWCVVDLVRDDGSFYRACAAHAEAELEPKMQVLRKHGQLNMRDHSLPSLVAREQTAKLVMDVRSPAELLAVTNPEQRAVVESLEPQSLICVPLMVRNRTLGTITLARSSRQSGYSLAELELAEDLAHRAAIAVDNARLYEEMCEVDRRKDEFLATIAHELRNPLAPIRHALEILETAGSQEELPRRARDTVQRQIDHMVRLVDDLLDVSRIMQGKIELRMERFTLSNLIERAVETAQSFIDSQGHTLKISRPENEVWLEADVTRIDQVVVNLLNNAAKYTDSGGQIELAAEVEEDQLVLRVKDNGIGIDPKLLGDIFDLFRQVDTSFSRSRGGLGIGLTLVRTLIEMHGGTVEAWSPGLGQGSEFIVRIPLVQKGAIELTNGADHHPSRIAVKAKHRVLVVDDNIDAADMLATVLRLEGHEIRTAYDGPAAIAQAIEFEPGFVLLDIGMPGMNGYEVALQLRQYEPLRKVVIVAMTGYGQDQDRRRSQEAGIDHHLVKPVAPDSLRAILNEQPTAEQV